MEQRNKNNKSKIFILTGGIILIIVTIIILLNQLKWKDFETCKTDKFEIKYNENWQVEDDMSEKYGKKFKNGTNTIEFYLMKKSDVATTRNTAKKLKDESLKQISNDNLHQISEYVNVESVKTDNVVISGLNGYKITFKISGISGISGALLYIEDDTYLYCMSLEGEDTETFNKMIESLKIKEV